MPPHFATERLKMLLFAVCMPVSAQAGGGDWDSGLATQARLQTEQLTPLVAGEQRHLRAFSASLELRERIRGGFHGGLIGGLPSIRWEADDSEESIRMGGRLLGLSLGGRHPEQGDLAFIWEGSYIWTDVGGSLGDGELDLSLRETASRAGLQWWPGGMGVTAGIARQRVSGEEVRSDGDAPRSRHLEWQSDVHGFLELGVNVDAGGWMSIRYSDRDPRGSITLTFGQQF
jgi:hypothetical protein